ncbi:hypothetical protein CXG81DRAFT_9250 [Caulochytrium protostelioides]|uniref:Uridine kinase n=1 Tax=Caulochytrium protostelioides TaxID=1555241 RepID=A0A4P9XDL2_9FUNG|nr:hypothetical protein CXG81DRAFT_9250 [Caulochytrium protostelioides]|eukprot:RKP03604.1 hypothetical protein CXG81DRAFT_9250 [Caulochytrium protostelioides]
MFSAGRYPWYNTKGENLTPYLLGIAGGSASGKTSVAKKILRDLGIPWVILMSMDSFYKSLVPEQLERAARDEYNFDHPDAFDYDLLYETLLKLKQGVKVDVPIYDFVTHSRLPRTKTMYGGSVVIFEGILALYDPRVRALMDMTVFVDTDADIRLARRLKRDISERGRTPLSVLAQYQKFVKPAYDEHIHLTMRHADIIVPRGLANRQALDLIAKHVLRQLNQRGVHIRTQLAASALGTGGHVDDDVCDCTDPATTHPANVLLLRQTPQLRYIMTQLRRGATERDDFIFYAERVARLVVERGLEALRSTPKHVLTPTGAAVQGVARADPLCGVSVMRSGATMEEGLRKVVLDIPIGKLLIQTDTRTLEPQLHYCKLPPQIHHSVVLLTDAQVATGAAALMAIRVLLDHNVAEDRIVFLCMIAAPAGIHAVIRAYPKVRIVMAEIERGLNDDYQMVPGMGNFGDRYFGT